MVFQAFVASHPASSNALDHVATSIARRRSSNLWPMALMLLLR